MSRHAAGDACRHARGGLAGTIQQSSSTSTSTSSCAACRARPTQLLQRLTSPNTDLCLQPQVERVCDQLLGLEQLQHGYVAVGFSQVGHSSQQPPRGCCCCPPYPCPARRWACIRCTSSLHRGPLACPANQPTTCLPAVAAAAAAAAAPAPAAAGRAVPAGGGAALPAPGPPHAHPGDPGGAAPGHHGAAGLLGAQQYKQHAQPVLPNHAGTQRCGTAGLGCCAAVSWLRAEG